MMQHHFVVQAVRHLALISAFLLGAGACAPINEQTNIDPNNPSTIRLDLLLAPVQTTYAFHLGSDLGRFSAIWSQQLAGNGGLHRFFERYGILESDMNAVWAASYADVLQELHLINELAVEADAPHYRGVSHVLEAALGMTLVDLFNDIPWWQAAAPGHTFTARPAYTPGAEVYANVDSLLTEAIELLSGPEGRQAVGADDLIYGGDVALWSAFAKTLRLRALLTRSELEPTTYDNILTLLPEGGIGAAEEDAQVPFATGNPYGSFEASRTEVVAGEHLVRLMLSLEDPRLPRYFTQANPDAGADSVYVGQSAGSPGSIAYSRMGPAWASDNSPMPLATHAEHKFIEAEAALATGDAARAANAYSAAIAASLSAVDVPGDAASTYLASTARDAASITREDILTQKYIALFPHPQAFTEYRRTGIPALQPARDREAVATRFPYAASERLYNAENFAPYVNTSVYDRVFWDVD